MTLAAPVSTVTQIRPLRLGPWTLDFPVVQAALSGYSDWPMRVLARRHGAPYTLCEVWLEKFLVEFKTSRKNRRFLYLTDEEHPVGGQLMGSDPELFAGAARRLAAAGFDVIDINFGCPVKKGTQCHGGYHLSQPDVALDIVARVRDALPPAIPVTVKMRRALDDSPAARDAFYRIFDGAFERGVAAITVHGRTVVQKYDGPSNWARLREIKRHAGTRTVLGSGDLFTPQACLEMLAATGVDGVTAARGAIGNPWIFREARALAAGHPLPDPPTVHEQRAVLAEHARLSAEIYDGSHLTAALRKCSVKYARHHPEADAVRNAFGALHSVADFETVLATWYAENRPGQRTPVEEPAPIVEPPT